MARTATSSAPRLGDYSTDRRVLLLSAAAVVIGVMAAGVAWCLIRLIDVITNIAYFGRLSAAPASPSQNLLGAAAVLVPVAGGLVIGAMARWGSPKIRGHGIPEALEAILIGRSRLDAKVAVLKPVSSAVSIGTGGPFGAEGPIIMTGGAFGSLFGQLLHLSAAERKTLLVSGAAAGMAAVFASPIAATLLAVELLLFEWKPRELHPHRSGRRRGDGRARPPARSRPRVPGSAASGLSLALLPAALVLGVVAGLGSGLLTALVYGFEDLFEKIPLHWMWWPAIGGLAVGLGGLWDPRILGVGYGTIHALLLGQVAPGAAAKLVVAKSVVWSLALGSGTSGGVLAPLLMMGGALGSLSSGLLGHADVGLWATLGMAAMMGGTMRAPLTAMFFAVELTQDWNLLPPLLVVCVGAYAVTVLLLRRSILTEKIARRGHHIVREYSVDPFELHRVGEVMDRRVPTVPATMTVGELARLVAGADPELARRQGTPILGADGRSRGDRDAQRPHPGPRRGSGRHGSRSRGGQPVSRRRLRGRAHPRRGRAHALPRHRPAARRRARRPLPAGRLSRPIGSRRGPPAPPRGRERPRARHRGVYFVTE